MIVLHRYRIINFTTCWRIQSQWLLKWNETNRLFCSDSLPFDVVTDFLVQHCYFLHAKIIDIKLSINMSPPWNGMDEFKQKITFVSTFLSYHHLILSMNMDGEKISKHFCNVNWHHSAGLITNYFIICQVENM